MRRRTSLVMLPIINFIVDKNIVCTCLMTKAGKPTNIFHFIFVSNMLYIIMGQFQPFWLKNITIIYAVNTNII